MNKFNVWHTDLPKACPKLTMPLIGNLKLGLVLGKALKMKPPLSGQCKLKSQAAC